MKYELSQLDVTICYVILSPQSLLWRSLMAHDQQYPDATCSHTVMQVAYFDLDI